MKPQARVIQQGRRAASQTHPALQGTASEKRFATRRERKTPALIVLDTQILGQKVPPISCLLKDTSSTGALIQLTAAVANRWSGSTSGLPESFRLQIRANSSRCSAASPGATGSTWASSSRHPPRSCSVRSVRNRPNRRSLRCRCRACSGVRLVVSLTAIPRIRCRCCETSPAMLGPPRLSGFATLYPTYDPQADPRHT